MLKRLLRPCTGKCATSGGGKGCGKGGGEPQGRRHGSSMPMHPCQLADWDPG